MNLILARHSSAHFNTQLELLNQSLGEGLDSVQIWSCPL